MTAAQAGVQRPLLLRALRLLRNAGVAAATARGNAIRRYRGYVRRIEQLYADLPQSVAGFPQNQNFGQLLEGLLGLTRTDDADLAKYGAETTDLVNIIISIRAPIEQARASRHWSSGARSRYNDFQPNDLFAVLDALRGVTERFDPEVGYGELSEDTPVKFDLAALPERVRDVAIATGGQAVANVEPLLTRIQVMLGDPRLHSVIDSAGSDSLASWLRSYLGPSEGVSEPLAIVDLSLVPSDVIHVAVAVIARLIFEALQRHLREFDATLPTVLVLEEAHSFVRREAETGANAAAGELCRQTFERIAREERKFGMGLVLASQRPSELSPTVLAQCNSFLLHRIVNDVDQNLVRRLVPDALGGLLGELPTLPSQQAIVLGWAVPTPVLVRIRDLAPRPRSADPEFWKTWSGHAGVLPDWERIATGWESAPGGLAGESDEPNQRD